MTLPRDLSESHQSAIFNIFRASSYSKDEKDFKLFFNALPSRKRPATAEDPNLECSQEVRLALTKFLTELEENLSIHWRKNVLYNLRTQRKVLRDKQIRTRLLSQGQINGS